MSREVYKSVSFNGSPDSPSSPSGDINSPNWSTAQRRKAFVEQTKRRKASAPTLGGSFLVSRESWDLMRDLADSDESDSSPIFASPTFVPKIPPPPVEIKVESSPTTSPTLQRSPSVPPAPPTPAPAPTVKTISPRLQRQGSLSSLLPTHNEQMREKWKKKLLSPVSVTTPESLRRNRTFEILNEFADLELKVENEASESDEEMEELHQKERSLNRSRKSSTAEFPNSSIIGGDDSFKSPLNSPPGMEEIEIPIENSTEEEKEEWGGGEEDLKFSAPKKSTWKEWIGILGTNSLMAVIVFLIILPSILSFANIMTSHPTLKPLFPVIIKALVATHMITQLVATLTSGVTVNVPGIHAPNVMFLALIGEDIAESARPECVLPTFVFCIILSTIIVGVTFIIVAYTGSIVLVQYIPYPVMAGFLAAISLFLMKGAVTMMAGMPLDQVSDIAPFFTSGKWLFAMIGVVLATSLFILERFKKHILFMPAFLFIPLTIFWIIASLCGTGIGRLQEIGFLLPTTETVPFHSVWENVNLDLVQFSLVTRQIPNMIAMTMLIILSTSVNLNALEFDLNRAINGKMELYVAGAGTMLSSLCSGLAAAITISLTGVSFRQGCNRLVGFFLVALFFGMFVLKLPITDYIPKFFFGTVLFFNGGNLVWAWLILPFYTIPRFEYLLLVSTALAILIFGNNIGLPLSVGISAIFFAIQYARIRSIRRTFQGIEIHSKVQRPYFQRKVLEHYQGKMLVLVLQNYLFFGSSIRIHDYIQKHLKDEPERKEKDEIGGNISKGFRKIASSLSFNFGKYQPVGEESETFELEEDKDFSNERRRSSIGSSGHRRRGSSISFKDIGGKMKGFLEGLSKEKRSTKVRYLIIDFASVPGVDSSSCTSFRKIVQLCKSRKITVIFTGMSMGVEKIFRRREVLASDCVKCYPDLDLALEWCENVVIKSKVKKMGTQLTEEIFQDSFEDYIPSFHVLLSNLMPPGSSEAAVSEIVNRYFKKRRLGEGEFLFVSGQPSTSLFYIKSGELSYYQVNPDGERTRLYKTLQGTWAGANSLLGLPETLTLEAEGPVVVYELTKPDLQKMEAEDPEIGHAVFTAVLQSMAQTLNILSYSLRIK